MQDPGSHEKKLPESSGAAHANNPEAPRAGKRDIFLAALEIESEQEQLAYLDQACGGDESLRRELDGLLKVEERPGFLKQEESFEKLNLQVVGGMAGDSSSSRPSVNVEINEGDAEAACGGMGRIRLAEDRKLKRVVAIKVIHRDAHTTPLSQARFLMEAEVLANLVHPNIVPIYDIVRESGKPLFYSMTLMKGMTLQAIFNELLAGDQRISEKYNLDRLLLIFRKVCDAIAFSHSRGIIHRDLKPENIMVGELGEVLVMNWGIAKKMDAPPILEMDESLNPLLKNVEENLENDVASTPYYMSPEQAFGHIDQMDRKSDIFSLGGILYTILTLRPPIEGTTLNEVLSKVTRGEILPPVAFKTVRVRRENTGSEDEGGVPELIRRLPHSRGGKVSPALSAVVMKALSLSKEDRYESVESLGDEIDAFQQGFATSAESAGVGRRFLLLIRRKVGILFKRG